MKIIRNAEKKLLQERIRQCDFTIRKCEENLNALKLSLQSKVSIEMNDRILALFSKTHSTFFEKSKNRQRQKFDRLQSTQKTKSSATNGVGTSINQENWVMNLSSRSLTVSERSVLMKGLNFRVRSIDRIPE